MVASLGLPHWLMIAGTLLVVAGFVGVLVSGKKAKELESPPDEPTEASHQQMPPLPSLLELQAKEQHLVTGWDLNGSSTIGAVIKVSQTCGRVS